MRKSLYTRQSEIVGLALKAIREEAGLTQRQLCAMLEREHSFVSKYEKGTRRVDVAEFYWICRTCGANAETQSKKVMRAFSELDGQPNADKIKKL